MLIEVFELLKTRIVISPAIWSRFDHPITENMTIGIPSCKVESAHDAEKKQHHMAVCCDAINRYNSFSISKLDCFWFTDSFWTYNDHFRSNYSYQETHFVEIVEIVILNTIFRIYIGDQVELYIQRIKIFL